jgi:hypothetical protein
MAEYLHAVSLREQPDGLLRIVGALAHPDDPDRPAGLWCVVLVDERPSDPVVVEVAVTAREPDIDPDAWGHAVLDAGRLRPGEQRAAISTNLLRTVPLAVVHEVVQERRGGRTRDATAFPDPIEVAATVPNPTELDRHDDVYFASWAALYVAAASSSRRPVVDLADRFDISRDKVRDTLNTARVRGLLTRGAPGRSGGALTDRAYHALNVEED